jgi:GT2 family glycosyltransferase
MTSVLACVIPAYGLVSLTQSVVRRILEELPPAHVIVVDNAGDYVGVSDETVVEPGSNLGWLRGCNRGMEAAFAVPGVAGAVLLNNDVTLSDGFVGGLDAAWTATGAGVIAPCYDDTFQSQSRYWVGAPARFPAQAREVPAVLVDGTCLLVSRDCYDSIGSLDEAGFAQHGWGAAADYCARARAVGHQVMVTRRSYLSHARAVTAHAVNHNYYSDAAAEMARGLAAKYGPGWRLDLGYAKDGPGLGRFRDRIFHSAKNVRQRLPGHR